MSRLPPLLALCLAVLPPLAAQEAPRRWPSLQEQLREIGAPPSSALAELIRRNQDFSRLRPEEAGDSLPIPPWLRALWRRSHPATLAAASDSTGGYPWVLPEVAEWMRAHPDLQAARDEGGLEAEALAAAAAASEEDAPAPPPGLAEKVSIGPNRNVSGAASPYRDNIYACYHEGLFPYVIRRSARTGEWSAPKILDSNPRHGTSVGCDVKTNGAGAVYVFWPSTGERKIYQAKSLDGGVTWSAPKSIFKTFGQAGMVIPGFARRTILLYTASAAFKVGTKDMAYLVWTDLSGATGCKTPGDQPRFNAGSNCKTRIWFARSSNGGKTWGKAVKLYDRPERTDQFHPWIAVDDTTGALAVIYYDTAGDPNRRATNVWVQTSTDAGAHWTAPQQVTSAPTDETTLFSTGFQFGDYNALSGIAGRFLPTWTDRRGGSNDQIWTTPITIP